MVPDVKAKWLSSLRDGQTRQGRNGLLGDGFCCLGVLCDIHRRENHKRWVKGPVDGYSYLGQSFYLPDAVIEWAGLHSCDPLVGPYGDHLSELNDHGKTFLELAELIEESL